MKGFIPFYKEKVPLNKKMEITHFPEHFSSFPVVLIIVMFMSSACKVSLPFALEYLYHRIDGDEFLTSLAMFVGLVTGSYFL